MLMMDFAPEVDRAMTFIETLDFTKPVSNHADAAGSRSVSNLLMRKSFQSNGVGFFETMIRYVGGLLSAYYLTSVSAKPHYRDSYAPLLLQKAGELSDVLNGGFNTTSGLPDRWIKVAKYVCNLRVIPDGLLSIDADITWFVVDMENLNTRVVLHP
jgi:hypothetical protein